MMKMLLLLFCLSAEGVEWPEEQFGPPDDAKDLINHLLQHNSVERLGSGGAHEVKEHVFFDGIDWYGLLRQKAEFVPQLEHDEDTSYFDSMYQFTRHHCTVQLIILKFHIRLARCLQIFINEFYKQPSARML